MRIKKQKSYLGSNLKLLRERLKKTQAEVATSLAITRAKLNAFENEVNINPTVDDLFKFINYFNISSDTLLWKNLKELSESQIRNLESGNDYYTKGTKIRILATTVDSNNRENIEIVPIKAKAGYVAGYGNPEFIESLQAFQLPVLSSNRKFRMFQIEGDSMLPIPDKSFVIGEYVEDWNTIISNRNYIVITKDDGIVFKSVINQIAEDRTFVMHSLNPNYSDYKVDIANVMEVWRCVYHVTKEILIYENSINDISSQLKFMKTELISEINKIQKSNALKE